MRKSLVVFGWKRTLELDRVMRNYMKPQKKRNRWDPYNPKVSLRVKNAYRKVGFTMTRLEDTCPTCMGDRELCRAKKVKVEVNNFMVIYCSKSYYILVYKKMSTLGKYLERIVLDYPKPLGVCLKIPVLKKAHGVNRGYKNEERNRGSIPIQSLMHQSIIYPIIDLR